MPASSAGSRATLRDGDVRGTTPRVIERRDDDAQRVLVPLERIVSKAAFDAQMLEILRTAVELRSRVHLCSLPRPFSTKKRAARQALRDLLL
jgi:hypothetical protein